MTWTAQSEWQRSKKVCFSSFPSYVLFLVKDAPSGALENDPGSQTSPRKPEPENHENWSENQRNQENRENKENRENQRTTKIREPVWSILLYFIFIQMSCDVSREVLTPRMTHVFRRRKHIDLNRQQGYSPLLLTKQNKTENQFSVSSIPKRYLNDNNVPKDSISPVEARFCSSVFPNWLMLWKYH